MSDMVTVDIRTPQNEILEGSQMPRDFDIQSVIDELIDTLELSRLDENSKPINYVLRSAQQNRTLSNYETIQTARINNGDILELQILDGNPSSEPPTTAPSRSGNTTEINVVLTVLDMNRSENVSLSLTRTVGDLIRQIISNYNLPARDHLNQINKYKLHSKAIGTFLTESSTLLESQIPPLDRLTLHREEIAG
jgi:uncharacterized ubiquitin-like protein YukD